MVQCGKLHDYEILDLYQERKGDGQENLSLLLELLDPEVCAFWGHFVLMLPNHILLLGRGE